MGWRTDMIKSVASLVIGFNLFFLGVLGFMIFYSTAQSVSEIAGTEIPDLPRLASDTVVLNGTEYAVNQVTVALKCNSSVTGQSDVNRTRYLKFEGTVEQINSMLSDPVSTMWQVPFSLSVPPRYQLITWTDNGDGELGSLDKVALLDIKNPDLGTASYTVEEVATAMLVNLVEWRLYVHLYAEPSDLAGIARNTSDPVGTGWVELYPFFGRGYSLTSWEDKNDDGMLSPSDIPEFSMEARALFPGPDGQWGTPDDDHMVTLFTPEMKQFLDSLSADFDPLTEELLALTEDTEAIAGELTSLSYLLLAMAIIGVVLMLYGTYKGLKIEKEPA